MNPVETINALPIEAKLSLRTDEIRALTSAKAGKIIPLAVSPLLREDRVSKGRARVRIEMGETAKTLMNAIQATVYVHFVPFLALERFTDLGTMNRSYKNTPEVKGGAVTPFFKTMKYSRKDQFWRALGIHAKEGAMVNASYVELYNELVNFRRRARSTKLPLRGPFDTSLAKGFWNHTTMRNIVPDFDQAAMDGEVFLNLAAQKIPVRGIGTVHHKDTKLTYKDVRETGFLTTKQEIVGRAVGGRHQDTSLVIEDGKNGFPAIYAELEKAGVRLSLANIDLAKQTAEFARMRKSYAGMDDEAIIDLLMSGIRVPDAQAKQPILLDRQTTILGYSRRYATNGADLDKSVTTGETYIDVSFRTPAMNTGGVIFITAEICPEQMFERQQDPFLHITNTNALPEFVRDFLDPEKVSIVRNEYVDVEHSNPKGTFGYSPLNDSWKRSAPRIGGKFMRQVNDPWSEDRQRIWSTDKKDPALTSDFYMVNDLPQSVFADTKSDPFEITTLGMLEIVGLTVFGKQLEESTDDYSILMEQVDTSRIGQVTK